MRHDDSGTPPGRTSISGTIEFQNVREVLNNVTIHVRVQDTSRADAAASTVAEQVLKGVSIAPGAPPIPFTVQDIPQNPGVQHVVRVHADVDGSGIVRRGDYVSTQSHPVRTSDPAATVKIVAREVR
jgi:uncharacterized lipoprotein YbaY